MSGMTKMPFSSSTASAPAVVGPFAPSQMILARILAALRLVMTFSNAAGTSTSTSSVSRSSFVIGSPPPNPSSVRCWRKYAPAAVTSMPFRL
jgi:hypothetical protein